MTASGNSTTESMRHQRLQSLFLLATQTTETQLEAVLDRECAGDPEMRRMLDRLLAADRRGGGLLDRPILAPRGPWVQVCTQCQACFDAGPEKCPSDGASLQPAFEGASLIDGRYRIEKRLGSGGMGAVYRALHIGLDKRFALKMIRSGPMLGNDVRDRFLREGKALGRLQHRHIVSVTDAGVDPRGRPYLVMELLDGVTLQAVLKREGPMPVWRALPILHAIASAIDYAHQHDVIHGDIKPGNVFIGADGAVKIVDFGLAELLDTGSRSTTLMGTPAYMSSAVLDGARAGKSADHHALAVLTYELLTGDVPYGWKVAEVRAAQERPLRRVSEMNAALPPELDAPAAAGLKKKLDSAADYVIPLEAGWHAVCVREWKRREIPLRCGIAVLLASALLLPAGWLAGAESFRTMEARTHDLRFLLRPDRPPDPRLVLVSIDDATLKDEERGLMERADEAGRRLQRVFAGGPEAVGIDLILPVQWSRSGEFQKLILDHAGSIKLGLLSSSQGNTYGIECMSPMTASALGGKAVDRMFAFVNLEEDPDGVTRRGRYAYADRDGKLRPLLASAVTGRDAASDEMFWLDQSIRWQDLKRISWKDLDTADPSTFRDRYVFVGEEFDGSGDESHRVPQRHGRPREMSGPALHALMAATILEGTPIRDLPMGWVWMRRLLLFTLAPAVLLVAPRIRIGAAVAAFVIVVSLLADLLAFRFGGLLLPMAADYVLLGAGAILALLFRQHRPVFPERV